ncbi:MAG TPA: cupin domain-containing protein [Xanthobacteraceae bacterium]|nr:cupin domain-containing protein [Xanthobacteraceae bacterium]
MATLLLWGAPGFAQDALTSAPNVFKKVMENDRLRVLEATFRAGEKVALHSHPEHLFYMLSDGTLVLKPPGRTPYEMTLTRGEAIYLPAQTRAAENDSNRAVRALIVEFKTPPPAAGANSSVKSKRTGRSRSARGKRGRRR